MSSKDQNLSASPGVLHSMPAGCKIGVVTAQWNREITFSLRDACIETLLQQGIEEENIISVLVPGSFELPSGAKMLLSQFSLDAVICLGCVIKGDTRHDEYISQAVSVGIMQLSIASGKPVIFGVLTPNNQEQAQDRAGGKYGNKGVEAANTALQMIQLAVEIRQKDKKSIGFS